MERDHTKRDGIDERDSITPTLIRYGISKTAELRTETNGWSSAHVGASGQFGIAPISVGFKLALLEADDGRHIPSLGVIVRAFPPSGTREYRSRKFSSDITVAADLALTPRASIHPNVGLITTTDDQGRRYTSALGAFTFVYAPTQALQPFVDVGITSPESRGGGSSVVFDTGIALIVRRDSQIDLEVGWSAAGRTTPNVFWGAGFSHRF